MESTLFFVCSIHITSHPFNHHHHCVRVGWFGSLVPVHQSFHVTKENLLAVQSIKSKHLHGQNVLIRIKSRTRSEKEKVEKRSRVDGTKGETYAWKVGYTYSAIFPTFHCFLSDRNRLCPAKTCHGAGDCEWWLLSYSKKGKVCFLFFLFGINWWCALMDHVADANFHSHFHSFYVR